LKSKILRFIYQGEVSVIEKVEKPAVINPIQSHIVISTTQETKLIKRRIMLEDRDYTLIIDKSGSMVKRDKQDGKKRWDVMQESTLALASKCEEFDPDGITVYTFSTKFRRYENVTASKVEQIFEENEPSGRTELAIVLQDAFQGYFQRKDKGETKPNGETIVVVTDGRPDDQVAVAKAIVEATQKMDKDEELAVSFIQIGNDPEASQFLKFLDDELKGSGAKFDIVDTVTIEEIEEEDLTLKDVLLRAITD
jgi:uncharacterized protein YegL